MPEEMKNIEHQIWDIPSGSSAAKDPFQFCLMKCLGEGDATSGDLDLWGSLSTGVDKLPQRSGDGPVWTNYPRGQEMAPEVRRSQEIKR